MTFLTSLSIILKRIFAKHKAFYPLLVIYRPIKGVITHPRGILTEYKKIKSFKKKEEP